MFLKIVLKPFPGLLAKITYKNLPLGKLDLHLRLCMYNFIPTICSISFYDICFIIDTNPLFFLTFQILACTLIHLVT